MERLPMVLAPLPLGTGPALLPVATGIWLQLWGGGRGGRVKPGRSCPGTHLP